MFAALIEGQKGFLPYEQGYALACNHISANSSVSKTHENLIANALHPNSKSVKSSASRVFFVVTPVFNGQRFLETTLDSILSQSGDFFIDYYVKDAASTDSTLQILAGYGDRIRTGRFPLQCHGIRFRVESSPDSGLYDALSQALCKEIWRSDHKTIQTYLNADDVMAPRALAIAAHVFDELPVRWLSGQTHVIDASGNVVVTPKFPLTFARQDIFDGLHDGRALYTIQQEGTFWLNELYQKSGGIDASLKLAGDFDLWRRFARHCDLLALDRPLASFRSHERQLSKQIELYHTEVDQTLSREPTPSAENQRNDLEFFLGRKSPSGGRKQRPGPVVFLSDECKVKEVAYLKRGWANW